MAQPTVPVPADLRLVQRPPSGRRRAETRYQCGPATPGRLLTDPAAAPLRAWVLNLSHNGAGILVAKALEPKAEFLLTIKSQAAGTVYQLRARVAHCTQQVNGEWLVGCELLTPLTDDDLDALL